MVVKVVEPLKARPVDLFWQGRTHTGVLHLGFEEVEGRRKQEAGEDQEDQRRPRQPLATQLLHREIEGEVHPNIGDKEEEEDRQELSVEDEQEERAEESVDGHEDDKKPKPGILL